MVLTNDAELARRAKHITTTAKQPHQYRYYHDEVGYNYRMPNINAAVGVSQIAKLEYILNQTLRVSNLYADFFSDSDIQFFRGVENTRPNYWLNTLKFKTENERNEFLEFTNSQNVMTRPPWNLMTDLPMYANCQRDDQIVSTSLSKTLLNIPSSVPELTKG